MADGIEDRFLYDTHDVTLDLSREFHRLSRNIQRPLDARSRSQPDQRTRNSAIQRLGRVQVFTQVPDDPARLGLAMLHHLASRSERLSSFLWLVLQMVGSGLELPADRREAR